MLSLRGFLVLFFFSGISSQLSAQMFLAPLVEEVKSGDTYKLESTAYEDFDGDGHTDIAVLTSNFNQVRPVRLTIHYGYGDGSFVVGPSYSTSGDYVYLATGQFGNDPLPDLVMFSIDSLNLRVANCNSDRTVTFLPMLPISYRVSDCRVADMTQDGYDDLILVSRADSVLGLMISNGDGTFTGTQSLKIAHRVSGLAVGHFNADSVIDATICRSTGLHSIPDSLSVYFGSLSQGLEFAFTQRSGVKALEVEMKTGDINGDGHDDLIIFPDGNGGATFSNFFMGNENGTPFIIKPFSGTYFDVDRMCVADIDQDGKDECLVANSTIPHLGVISISIEADTFVIGFESYFAGTNLTSLDCADINNDSFPDMIGWCNLQNTYEDYLSILFNEGTGIYPGIIAEHLTVPSNSPYGNFLVSGNFDSDSLPDWAYGGSEVMIRSSRNPQQNMFNPLAGVEPGFVLATDIDFDGYDDLVLTNVSDQTLRLYLCDRDGYFKPPITLATGVNSVFGKLAQLNNDRFLDLVYSRGENQGMVVRLGDESGLFAAEQVFFPNQSVYVMIASADFNGDHLNDLAVQFYIDSLVILAGNGAGGFSEHLFSMPGFFEIADAAHIDSDTHIDMVARSFTLSPSSSLHQLFYGNGDGTFQLVSLDEPGNATAPRLGDLNDDGNIDLIIGGKYGIEVIPGAGNRTFGKSQRYLLGSPPQKLYPIDQNGDQALDVIAVSFPYIFVLPGREVSASCCVGTRGNIDCDPANVIDISDLLAFAESLFITSRDSCCLDAEELDGEPGVDIGDLITLVDHLFITFQPLPSCN